MLRITTELQSELSLDNVQTEIEFFRNEENNIVEVKNTINKLPNGVSNNEEYRFERNLIKNINKNNNQQNSAMNQYIEICHF
mgnify:CR=1 FL=1